MACAEEIIKIACKIRPDQATLVPERRKEVTTEGGLDVVSQLKAVKKIVARLQDRGIAVSLFLDPDPNQIEAGVKTGCDAIEIHTGCYALAETEKTRNAELHRIQAVGRMIRSAGLRLHAGHGLTYHNVVPIAAIPNMLELNIGHSIIARALMVGMKEAVVQMKQLLIRSEPQS
jgi:pyridoxine 5-phosphate synthase